MSTATKIARWRIDRNEVCAHSSFGWMPPAKFAAQHRQTTVGAVAAPLQTQEWSASTQRISHIEWYEFRRQVEGIA